MKIVVLGELCEDILLHCPHSVEVLGQKIWAKDITVTAGGSAAYVSQALSRMGAQVRLCSVLGDDASGERLLRTLREFSVDCSLVRVLPDTDTTKSIVLCDGAEKDFQGCSPMLPLELPSLDELEGAQLLYIAGYTIYPELWTPQTRDFLQEVKSRGVKIALDVQLLPIAGIDLVSFSRLDGVLPYIDLFFAARKEAVGLFGTDDVPECMRRLREMKFGGTAVFKRGRHGSIVANGEEFFCRKSCPVEVYDAVGSGDIFGASYCYGVLSGWDNRRCADYASAYTALSIGEYHNVKNYPAKEAVEALLSTIE